MLAVMPVTSVPPRRPLWERPVPHHEPSVTPQGPLPVIDLAPLPLDEDMEFPVAPPPRAAGFPTGLILDIRA